MKRKGESFLSEEELKAKAQGWTNASDAKEKHMYVYPANRHETGHNDGIESIHGISFIREVIPHLIEQKTNGEPVKILDLGGGSAVYADQIRQVFGDRVKVYTTGIRKKTAKDTKLILPVLIPQDKIQEGLKFEPRPNLHKNDLKWRSVQQLSDTPEFDLILDTFGEQYYIEETPEEFRKYMTAVVNKLNFGGIASIAPGRFHKYISFSEMEDGIVKPLDTKEKPYVLRFQKPKH